MSLVDDLRSAIADYRAGRAVQGENKARAVAQQADGLFSSIRAYLAGLDATGMATIPLTDRRVAFVLHLLAVLDALLEYASDIIDEGGSIPAWDEGIAFNVEGPLGALQVIAIGLDGGPQVCPEISFSKRFQPGTLPPIPQLP